MMIILILCWHSKSVMFNCANIGAPYKHATFYVMVCTKARLNVTKINGFLKQFTIYLKWCQQKALVIPRFTSHNYYSGSTVGKNEPDI